MDYTYQILRDKIDVNLPVKISFLRFHVVQWEKSDWLNLLLMSLGPSCPHFKVTMIWVMIWLYIVNGCGDSQVKVRMSSPDCFSIESKPPVYSLLSANP